MPATSASTSIPIPTSSATPATTLSTPASTSTGSPPLLPSSASPTASLDASSRALLAQFHSERTQQEAKFARLEAKARKQERERKKANAEEGASQSQTRVNGSQKKKRDEDDEEDEEQSLAEAEAWADIERLARIEAGEEVPDDLSAPPHTQSHHNINGADSDDDLEEDDEVISVDEWRQIVKEDYQQSQFWYSSDFAYLLARHIHAHLETLSPPPTTTTTVSDTTTSNGPDAEALLGPSIAFVCSPTAFVAFQHLYASRKGHADPPSPSRYHYCTGKNLFLLEIDERFKVVAGSNGFVRYDFNTPLKNLSEFKGKIDMVVIDPPFLNEFTTDQVATSVAYLLRPPPTLKEDGHGNEKEDRGGSILLLTGDSISEYAKKTYPLKGQPDLVRTLLDVQHDGGRLSNDFGAWASWKGGEWIGQ